MAPLVAALRDLVRWLRASRAKGAIIGGVAASLLGRPRFTRDVDALVLLEDNAWAPFLSAGAAFGLVPRRPDALAFARRTRVLLLRHEPSGIDVDVSLGTLPFEEEAVARARSRRVIAGVSVPLVSPEDLIVMKAIAHRPRDIADIESLVDARPALDRTRIRRWVREFAAILHAPELVTDLERVLNARKTAGSKRRR